jgi:hypothetical protein
MAGSFTNREKAAEARREVKQRERVYPRLIQQGKLKADKAADQIRIMIEIAEDYERTAHDAGEPIGSLL